MFSIQQRYSQKLDCSMIFRCSHSNACHYPFFFANIHNTYSVHQDYITGSSPCVEGMNSDALMYARCKLVLTRLHFLLLDCRTHLFWRMFGHAAHLLARNSLARGVLPGEPLPRRGVGRFLPKVRRERRSSKNTPQRCRNEHKWLQGWKMHCYTYSYCMYKWLWSVFIPGSRQLAQLGPKSV